MEALQYSLEALEVLFNAGLLTNEEMDLRRQLLLDEYIGYPSAPTSKFPEAAVPADPAMTTAATPVGHDLGESAGLDFHSSASCESPPLSELSAAALRVLLGPPDAPVPTTEDMPIAE
eukprot:RCo021608